MGMSKLQGYHLDKGHRRFPEVPWALQELG